MPHQNKNTNTNTNTNKNNINIKINVPVPEKPKKKPRRKPAPQQEEAPMLPNPVMSPAGTGTHAYPVRPVVYAPSSTLIQPDNPIPNLHSYFDKAFTNQQATMNSFRETMQDVVDEMRNLAVAHGDPSVVSEVHRATREAQTEFENTLPVPVIPPHMGENLPSPMAHSPTAIPTELYPPPVHTHVPSLPPPPPPPTPPSAHMAHGDALALIPNNNNELAPPSPQYNFDPVQINEVYEQARGHALRRLNNGQPFVVPRGLPMQNLFNRAMPIVEEPNEELVVRNDRQRARRHAPYEVPRRRTQNLALMPPEHNQQIIVAQQGQPLALAPPPSNALDYPTLFHRYGVLYRRFMVQRNRTDLTRADRQELVAHRREMREIGNGLNMHSRAQFSAIHRELQSRARNQQ
jgi:hypothetical protein